MNFQAKKKIKKHHKLFFSRNVQEIEKKIKKFRGKNSAEKAENGNR